MHAGFYMKRIQRNLFGDPLSAAITVLALAAAAFLLNYLVRWAILDASWSDGPIKACESVAGACWTVIAQRYRIILFGLYPYEEQWRAGLGSVIALVTVGLACTPYFWTALRMILVWVVGYALFFMVVRGGFPLGLPIVSPTNWGGLTLTLFIYLSAIAIGLPLATLIALLRESEFRRIAGMVGVLVDLVRALPIITLLLVAVMILPFVITGGVLGDKTYRVIAAFVLFFACYQSENIRAGLQSVPAGQVEAGRALGMRYWKIMGYIVLPQAFRFAMPATINQFVITFKETSLVAIIGLYDLMASANAAFNTGQLQIYYKEVMIFVAAIYFILSILLSRYGSYIERLLTPDAHRR